MKKLSIYFFLLFFSVNQSKSSPVETFEVPQGKKVKILKVEPQGTSYDALCVVEHINKTSGGGYTEFVEKGKYMNQVGNMAKHPYKNKN